MNRVLPAILATVGIALGILLFALFAPLIPSNIPTNNSINMRPRRVTTPIPPEVTVVPDGAVFTAPGSCDVSPDESQIALNGYGVFSLPAGEKLYALPGLNPLYSPDGRYISTQDLGVYDAKTGQPVLSKISSPYPREFSPVNSLFIDGEGVYDLATGNKVLEIQSLSVNSDPMLMLVNDIQFGSFLPNGDVIVYTFDMNINAMQAKQHTKVYDAATMTVLIDTNSYDFSSLNLSPEMPLTPSLVEFSSDMTRVVILGVGLFSYPEMELLAPLPKLREVWQTATFNSDGTLLKSFSFADDSTTSTVKVSFIKTFTGELVNQFTFPAETPILPGYRPYHASETFNLIAVPRYTTGVISTVLAGWELLEMRTGELVAESVGDTPDEAMFEQLYGNIEAPYVPPVEWHVHGRYTTHEGVIDATSKEVILPLAGLEGTYLTEGGTYAVTQRPCVVWALP